MSPRTAPWSTHRTERDDLEDPGRPHGLLGGLDVAPRVALAVALAVVVGLAVLLAVAVVLVRHGALGPSAIATNPPGAARATSASSGLALSTHTPGSPVAGTGTRTAAAGGLTTTTIGAAAASTPAPASLLDLADHAALAGLPRGVNAAKVTSAFGRCDGATCTLFVLVSANEPVLTPGTTGTAGVQLAESYLATRDATGWELTRA